MTAGDSACDRLNLPLAWEWALSFGPFIYWRLAGDSNERSTGRLSGAFFERADARFVFRTGYSMAAVVCRSRRHYQHPVLRVAAEEAVATRYLGASVHGDQPVSNPADLF